MARVYTLWLLSFFSAGCSYDLGPGICEHVPVTKICDEDYCRLPAGCFVMGSPLDEPCRESGTYSAKETQHRVRLTRPILFARHEVTQKEYQALMGTNPSTHTSVVPAGGDCAKGGCYCEGCTSSCENAPVENLSWLEAVAYCNALSSRDGLQTCYEGSKGAINRELGAIQECKGYRLPTEAEWEYAYRAGTQTAYHSGPNDANACQGRDAALDEIAWYRSTLTHAESTRAVGTTQPNLWGIYDLAGNVFEWTHDGFLTDLGEAPVVDPVGVYETWKVTRGGAIDVFNTPLALRAAFRSSRRPAEKFHLLGFRCVRSELP